MDGEAKAAVPEAEIAEQCGILNVATGRLVSLIGQVLAAELARSATVTHIHWEDGGATDTANPVNREDAPFLAG